MLGITAEFLRICRARDTKAAIDFQNSLRGKLQTRAGHLDPQNLCAFDVSYDKSTRADFGAAAMVTFPDLRLIEEQTERQQADFPYVPGLLAFREGPVILDLYDRLGVKPDILLVEGHGVAHPRGFGIASLLGVLLDMPAIGFAKTRLVGEYNEPGPNKGDSSELLFEGQVVGRALRTRRNVRPVFVSIGHKIGLKQAAEIVLQCCTRYRLPDPLRRAHGLANELRRANS